MSQAVADRVRHLRRVAINVNYELAPDADILAGSDSAFWREYPEALKFAGRKFSAWNAKGVDKIANGLVAACSCSGVLALEAAYQFGGRRMLLLGMDFSGGHYFGEYRGACKRTTATKWSMHRNQFKAWKRARKDAEVLNCTPESKLDVFPLVDLETALATA